MTKVNLLRSAKPVIVFIACSLLFCGCAHRPKPGRFAIRVEMAPELLDHSVQVDFIADPTFPRSRWEGLNVNDYWTNSPLRNDAKPITLKFGPGQSPVQTIALTEPRYAEWLKRKPVFAVVIKDEPIHLPDPGPNDSRRLIISLDERAWAGRNRELKVVIQQSGIKVETPPNPKSK